MHALPRACYVHARATATCDAREVLALRVGGQPVGAADAGELWLRVRVRARVRLRVKVGVSPNANPNPSPNLGRSSRAASRG